MNRMTEQRCIFSDQGVFVSTSVSPHIWSNVSQNCVWWAAATCVARNLTTHNLIHWLNTKITLQLSTAEWRNLRTHTWREREKLHFCIDILNIAVGLQAFCWLLVKRGWTYEQYSRLDQTVWSPRSSAVQLICTHFFLTSSMTVP
jgi:hypothetical protein